MSLIRKGYSPRSKFIRSGFITAPRLAKAIESGEVRTMKPGIRLVLVNDEDVHRLVTGKRSIPSNEVA